MSGLLTKNNRAKSLAVFLFGVAMVMSLAFTPETLVAGTSPESVQPASGLPEVEQAASIVDNAAPVIVDNAAPVGRGTSDEPDGIDVAVEEGGQDIPAIADPLKPLNAVAFLINDKLYFWVIKPVSRGYAYIVPEPVRTGFGNAYDNLKSPSRLINKLLQLRFRAAGKECARFLINSTFGVAGVFDAAGYAFDMKKQDADFGQTLGCYGLGQGLYIVWPVIGPSSLRETIGLGSDVLMSPLTYVRRSDLSLEEKSAITAHEKVNDTSFRIGDYESFKSSALDPYTAMRDAFVQHRNAKVKQCNTNQ